MNNKLEMAWKKKQLWHKLRQYPRNFRGQTEESHEMIAGPLSRDLNPGQVQPSAGTEMNHQIVTEVGDRSCSVGGMRQCYCPLQIPHGLSWSWTPASHLSFSFLSVFLLPSLLLIIFFIHFHKPLYLGFVSLSTGYHSWFVFERFPVQNSAQRTSILSKVYHGFTQSLQKDV